MKAPQLISLNPNKNYEVIGQVSISTHAEVDHSVAKARAAQQGWRELGYKKRIALLEKIYKEFVKRKNDIGSLASREMGMPSSVRNKIDQEHLPLSLFVQKQTFHLLQIRSSAKIAF
jgi:acyl-CoA reductase-like NAD-dependent aldehyde dehydrogenase